MKKSNFVLIIFLYLTSIVSFISNYSICTFGWANASNTTNINEPSSYSYLWNYGTHDYLAESALEVLFQKLTGSEVGYEFVKDLHNNIDNYKNFYLLGTEVPDRRNADGVYFTIKTKCGSITQAEVKIGQHRLRFSGNRLQSDKSSQALCNAAEDMSKAVINAFREKDCQKAAFFLGCITHYIADATFYTHLIDNIISHRSYIDKVLSVTKNVYSYSYIKRQNEFFNIIESYDSFNGNVKKKPYDSTYLAGLDTRYGNYYLQSFTSTLYEDADWLDFYAPTMQNYQFWTLSSYTPSSRPTSGNAKKYFDTVEHNLNTAIYYCAAAINFLIDNYQGKDCNTNGGQNNPIDPLGGGVGDRVGVRVKQYSFLFIWQFLGMMSTLTALTVIKQLKAIAPLLF